MQQQIDFSDEDLAYGESTLASWASPRADPPSRWQQFEAQNGARALIRLSIAAEEIVAAARLRQSVAQGIITPEQLLASLDPGQLLQSLTTIGDKQAEADAFGPDVGALYMLARGEVMAVYRRTRSAYGWPKLGPADVQLGGWIVPLIVVGGAALVASSWLVSKEVAPAWKAVEAERAWSAARAYAEITTNKALIAAGQKPILSDWARLRSSVARVESSRWTHFAAGAGVGAIGLMGAYYGLTKIGSSSRPRRAPRRDNPAPRRRPNREIKKASRLSKPKPKRRKNQQQRFGFADPKAKQRELPGTHPEKPKPKPKRKRAKKGTKGPALKPGSRAELLDHLRRGWVKLYDRARWHVIKRRTMEAGKAAWVGIVPARTKQDAELQAGWGRHDEGGAWAVIDAHDKPPTIVMHTGEYEPRRNPSPKRKNPSPGNLHDWATVDADRAVDAAIGRRMKRWPTKPRPADVDALATRIGRWPSRSEFDLYAAAWTEQVQRRKLKSKKAGTAKTVKVNPGRDKRGRFAKGRRPKGPTRGARRGKPQRSAARKSRTRSCGTSTARKCANSSGKRKPRKTSAKRG